MHLYNKIGVAIIALTAGLKVGDKVHFKGKKTDFSQTTSSLQLEHEPLTKAGKGQQVGFKLETGKEVQVGDEVFLAKE